ncbi:MAG: hypothetical protein COB53_00785 [Elusimicrobia bacterium]|nr:MAG: hypothetical protein COB53_00785 [Elusimicrobiota bacterium]
MSQKTSSRIRESLYDFHKELNHDIAGEDEMLARGLRLIGERVKADRIGVFLLTPRRRELSLQVTLHSGLLLEMVEEIHLTEESGLWKLVHGRKKLQSYSSPHALLYVPLRWTSGGDEAALGALRFERVGSRKPFSAAEREFARLLSAELAQNLYRARVGQARQRQLKRLEALTDLAAVFASSLRVEDGLKLILQGIVHHFDLDRARLYLVDREQKNLRGELSVDVRGTARALREEMVPLGDENHRFARILRGEAPDAMMKHYEERVVHVPLAVQGQKIGLLVVDNLISQEAIQGEDIGLLRSFAGQIALAVDNGRLFEEVQALSLYDSLTGLPVRRYFNQRFQEELYRVERSREPLSVAMIDIDFFKGINDSFGHQIGDEALKLLGVVINNRLRKIDFPARFGGDEVLILLPQTNAEDAAMIMDRLLNDIREIRIPVPFAREGEVRMSASIGIASYPEDGRTAKELIARADEALYWVKSKGRDAVAAYGAAIGGRSGPGRKEAS